QCRPPPRSSSALLLCCCFCWDHLHLHSFPTRRSSDLVLPGEMPDARVADARGPHVLALARLLHEAHELLRVLGEGTQPPGALEVDRKSTRLNSSHVKISYAVFCLKKKNQADYHRRSE